MRPKKSLLEFLSSPSKRVFENEKENDINRKKVFKDNKDNIKESFLVQKDVGTICRDKFENPFCFNEKDNDLSKQKRNNSDTVNINVKDRSDFIPAPNKDVISNNRYYSRKNYNELTSDFGSPMSCLTPKSSQKAEKRFNFLDPILDDKLRKTDHPDYNPSKLFISEQDLNVLTNFEKQYWMIKKEYFDTVIFFKKGKFYELYEGDAEMAKNEFGLKVTERVNMCMAGFPVSSYDFWAAKFLEKCYKIGRVDQSENQIGKIIREREEEENRGNMSFNEAGKPRKSNLFNEEDGGNVSYNEAGKPRKSNLFNEENSGNVSYNEAYKPRKSNLFNKEEEYGGNVSYNEAGKPRKSNLLNEGNDNFLYEEEVSVNRGTPKTKKSAQIINRELKEIITRGTIYNYEHLENYISLYLCILIKNDREVSMLLFDASINTLYYSSFTDEDGSKIQTIFAQYKIVELITDENIKIRDVRIMKPIRGGSCINYSDHFEKENEYRCFIFLYNYMKELKREKCLENIKIKRLNSLTSHLILDSITLRNLEILENNVDGSEKFTLFGSIDHCITPQGKRLLRKWISTPLRNSYEIKKRQCIIELCESLDLSIPKELLKEINDTERIISKLFSDNPTVKDLKLFLNCLSKSFELIEALNIIIAQNFGVSDYSTQNEIELVGEENSFNSDSLFSSFVGELNETDKTEDRLKLVKNAYAGDLNETEKTEDRLKLGKNAYAGDQCNSNKTEDRLNLAKNAYPGDQCNSNKTEDRLKLGKNAYAGDRCNVNNTEDRLKLGKNIFSKILEDVPKISHIYNDLKSSYTIKQDELIPLRKDNELKLISEKIKKVENQLTKYLEKQKLILKNNNLSFKNIGKELYQIEVPLNLNTPNNYILVSSSKTHKRFYTDELKILVNQYREFEEMIFQKKGMMLRNVVDGLRQYINEFYTLSEIVSIVDCYISLAFYQKLHQDLTTPLFGDCLIVENMTSPIYRNYVTNNLNMLKHVMVLTGPNMGGKSTLLRIMCHNIILAQMGLKVFCKSMKTKLFDQIFTRIGANDNLLDGKSTFMVELMETSKILNESTKDSFVIIDELGRGTATKDGEAIAKSVLEYLVEKKAYCLFSTHYHEIIKNIDVMKGYMKVATDGNDIIFLYKLEEGICNDSHGIEVAKIAGVPQSIIMKALEFKSKLNN